MSDGFELGPFHVPQQSRRDKLRSVEGCAGLHHLYDPLLLCTAGDAFLHPTYPLSLPPAPKQEPLNAVSLAQAAAERHEPFFSFSSSSTSTSSHPLLDLPPSVNINPSNPFLYAAQEPQNLRDFDQPFHDCRGAFKPPQAPPQGLSLSLSSQSFGGDPCVLTEKGMESYVMFDGDMWRSTGPLGPFTGYAEVLKGSRFLKPAQQLLEEFCDVGKRVFLEGVSAVDVEMERWSNSTTGVLDNPAGIGVGGDGGEQRRKKSRLISMLDEVYRRYKIYYQQMQTVVASFESVHGLSNAAPYASFALKTLSKHFRAIKNAITDQIRTISNSLGEELGGKEGTPKFRIVDERLHQQKEAHGMGVHEQPHVWRPQRGLPERAVAVLRAWLFEHFLHPYPTDSDKQMLAKQTGLSRSQVSNWFINARVRLWKPMVEEIHSLEMRQKVSGEEDQHSNRQGALTYSQDEHLRDTTLQRDQEPSLKRFGNEFSQIPDDVDESMGFSYNGNLSHHHLQPPVAAGGNTGVSLTLGLHQNNGACLSQPLPLTHVANFGMGDGNSTYGIPGFGSQNRQFGRNIGGQLLYDFVG